MADQVIQLTSQGAVNDNGCTIVIASNDVVDDANERRGFFSINALWKNKAAVLVGDFLLTRGLALALRDKQYYLLQIVSDAFEAITEGELLQLEKAWTQ